MKITSMELPNGYHGLAPLVMRGMGDIVLLAGPNGSGKSRLLEAVGNYARLKLLAEEVERLESEVRSCEQNIAHYESQISVLVAKSISDHRIQDLQNAAEQQRQRAENIRSQIEDSRFVTIDKSGRKPVVVDYRVNRLDLKDSRLFQIGSLLSSSQSMASEFNVGLANEYGLAAVHDLLYRHVHAIAGHGASDVEKLKADVERLKGLVRDFLLTDLEYSAESGPMLFGKPIAEARLSKGQVVLLQILLSLFFQDGTKEDLLLLLDEPETHLHPGAVLQLVDRVRSSCPHAQIWIATHSLHLLAHFDNELVWFVKDGVVEYAGSRRLEVLNSLIGDERGIEELSEFLTLPAKGAVLNFAAQCMGAPSVADTDAGDPQTSQIAIIIQELRRKVGVLRVLDFGMGKGRLLTELVSSSEGRENIDYLGFDLCATEENQRLCKERLAHTFGEGVERYWSNIADLRRCINRQSVHVVVMCNVLHEIPPAHWAQVFGENGYLTDLLHPEGFLLVVEDQLMKMGERAHEFGFLVLSETELRELFSVPHEDRSFVTQDHPESRYSRRLKAHLVPAAFVSRVSAASTRSAIIELKGASFREVQRLQNEQYSLSKGREYAFWAHQYVNANLALGGQTA